MQKTCVECGSNADSHCKQCNDDFCTNCLDLTHKSKSASKHSISALQKCKQQQDKDINKLNATFEMYNKFLLYYFTHELQYDPSMTKNQHDVMR